MKTTMKSLVSAAGLLALSCSLACSEPLDVEPTEPRVLPEIERQEQALASGVFGEGTVPFGVGMDLGVGLDVASKTVLSQAKCLDFGGQDAEIESHAYQGVVEQYTLVRDKSELRELIDLSAKIGGVISVLKLEIEAKYFDEIGRNKNSVYVLVHYDFLTRSYGIRSPRMTLDGFDGREGRADNRDGSVPGTVRNYYHNGYDQFRKKCGDRYLQGVVTGGRYTAVLEIETTSQLDKNLVEGKLKGTWLPLMLGVSGSLELKLAELKTNHQIKVHVVSRGDNRPDSVVSLSDLPKPDPITVSELTDDINRFKAAILASDQQSGGAPSGYRRAPIYALFASYGPTANELTQGGFPTEQVEQMRLYAEAGAEYGDVEQLAAEVLMQPGHFANADDVQVELVQRDAQLSQKTLELTSQRCALPSNPVCPSVASLGLPTPAALRASLPASRALHPRDCREQREMFDDDDDGEKLVYLGGREDQPFMLYCADMAEPEPVSYLPLGNFDPPSTNPGTNYARALGGVDRKGVAWPDALSIYQKLRVHVSDDHLTVVPGQEAFVTDGAGAVQPSEQQVPWGSARTCRSGRQLAAVSDLTATGFTLEGDVPLRLRERGEIVATTPMTWFEAESYARARGASLLHVTDLTDQQRAAALIASYDVPSVWLGLMNSRTEPLVFSWMDGVATGYRNWAPGYPRAQRGEQSCGWLKSDGLFREGSCREKRPMLAELRRVLFDVERPNPAKLRLFVNARTSCGTVEPNPELRLGYVGGVMLKQPRPVDPVAATRGSVVTKFAARP